MMFLPRESFDQHLLSSELLISPEPAVLRFSDDALGNRLAVAQFSVRASTLVFNNCIRVEHSRSHPAGLCLEERALMLPVPFDPDELSDLRPFLKRRYRDPDGILQRWADGFLSKAEQTSTIELLTSMIHAVRGSLTYIRRDKGLQDPAETLSRGTGSCRDFTELMIEALRVLGLPARFVSGYLYVPDRDSHDVHGGGATHAWVQVYLPGAGWVDIDPTNAILGNEGLIRVAVARDPSEALPLSGSYEGSDSDFISMEVTVKVSRDDAADVIYPVALRR